MKQKEKEKEIDALLDALRSPPSSLSRTHGSIERKKVKIQSPPALTLVDAVNTLLNNRIPHVTESKAGTFSSVSFTYPPELVTVMKSMFPASKRYAFEIHASITAAASGGGVISGNISWSPSVSSFTEWTALAALFDEVKLKSSELQWTSTFGPTSTAIIVQIAVAPDFSQNAPTPTFTLVQRLAQSRMISIGPYGDNGSSTTRFVTRVRDERAWCVTTTPFSSSPVGGCLGCWCFASNIVTTASINYGFLALKNTVLLRCRA